MGILNRFLGEREQPIIEECALVYLDGVNLRDEVYAECDLSTLEDQLIEVIQKTMRLSWTDTKLATGRQRSSHTGPTQIVFTL